MRELVLTEETGIGLAAVHVKRHDVGLFQQLVQGFATLGVAQGELFLQIVEHHAHTERLGQHRKLRADIAVADDAQGLAADLVGAAGGLIPHAVLHMMRMCRNTAQQADDVTDDQLHHGAGVRIRCVEHGDAMRAGIVEIDLIGADAEAADGAEVRSCVDDLPRDGRLGSHAKQIDAIKRFDELVLAQSALHGGDGESVIAQRLGCVGMDVFQ